MNITLPKKSPTTTEEEYLWMVGQLIDSGQIPSWRSVNDQINKELGIEEDKWRDESSFRKRYQAAKNFKENCFDRFKNKEDFNQLQEVRDVIYKEKKKLFDQRREYNKLLTKEARFDHLTDYIKQSVNDINNNLPLLSNDKRYIVNKDREGLVCFSDWHYGMNTDNIWNFYNTDVCKQRVKKLLIILFNILLNRKLIRYQLLLLEI